MHLLENQELETVRLWIPEQLRETPLAGHPTPALLPCPKLIGLHTATSSSEPATQKHETLCDQGKCLHEAVAPAKIIIHDYDSLRLSDRLYSKRKCRCYLTLGPNDPGVIQVAPAAKDRRVHIHIQAGRG